MTLKASGAERTTCLLKIRLTLMTTIHWLGNGLSSEPGLKRLAGLDNNVTLWCRRTDDGQALLAGCASQTVRYLNWSELPSAIAPGDIVVSMLPASEHLTAASICLDRNAHFVSSSYVSDDMRGLHKDAIAKGLTFINEVGLDPGLDHLLAHDLIEIFKQSEHAGGNYQHHFRSYCGGFPSTPNAFKYRFSWSPVGVLRALKSPASWVQDNTVQHTDRPWKALTHYTTPNSDRERFQAYPNRDSIPFIQQYHLPEHWQIAEFVRGTLRLEGWAEAWQDIFNAIDQLHDDDAQVVLKQLSDKLWQEHAYQPGETDRVVLCVEHEVKDAGQTIWHKAYTVDEAGNERGSAMGRLVSLTVSLAVQATMAGQLPAGVLAATSDQSLIRQWIASLRSMGESIRFYDAVCSKS